MKRSVLLLAALFAALSVQADNRPQAVLKQLTAALGALEGYSVVFEVHTDGDVVPGYYEVSGDNYYMYVNGQEVYGDAEFRYEIDPDRKEVVIDRVDLTSHNLLNNPTRAFDFIDGEYAASLLSEKGSTAVIRLTPLRIQSAVGQIDVEVDTARSLPTAVIYEIDGDRVRIDIRSVTVHEASPRTFDAENYAGYEWIDFRLCSFPVVLAVVNGLRYIKFVRTALKFPDTLPGNFFDVVKTAENSRKWCVR